MADAAADVATAAAAAATTATATKAGPEVTTLIRWILRIALVFLLLWVVQWQRGKEEDDDDEEEDEAEQRIPNARRAAGLRAAGNNRFDNNRMNNRMPKERMPNSNNMRERRPPVGNNATTVDFDSLITKMSKPNTMWESRKDGAKPRGPTPGWVGDTPLAQKAALSTIDLPSLTGGSGALPGFSGFGGLSSGATRKPLELKSTKGEAADKPVDMSLPPHKREVASARLPKASLHGHERPITFITWNQDGNLLFSCGKDKMVCVWSFPDGECIGKYTGHNGACWSCSITTDSRWLVTSAADQRIIVWEANEARELARIELPGVARFVEWASSGGESCERFVTAHNKFGKQPEALTVFSFDGEKIEQLIRITGLPSGATQVRWGLRDEVVASSHENGEMVWWRVDTGAEVARLQAHDEVVQKFDFSLDRELLATVSRDNFVKVWHGTEDGTKWELLYKYEADRPLNAVHFAPLNKDAALAAPSGRPQTCSLIAAGGQDVRDVALKGAGSEQFGTLLFRFGNGAEFPAELEAIGVTKGHFGPVHTLTYSRDGYAIASGSEDGCVRLHAFDPNAPFAPPTPAASPEASSGPEEATAGADSEASKDVDSDAPKAAEA